MEKELTFEKAMKRLEEIVNALENGTVSLDDSLKLFEEGIKLSKYCENELKNIENKASKILMDSKEEKFEENKQKRLTFVSRFLPNGRLVNKNGVFALENKGDKVNDSKNKCSNSGAESYDSYYESNSVLGFNETKHTVNAAY